MSACWILFNDCLSDWDIYCRRRQRRSRLLHLRGFCQISVKANKISILWDCCFPFHIIGLLFFVFFAARLDSVVYLFSSDFLFLCCKFCFELEAQQTGWASKAGWVPEAAANLEDFAANQLCWLQMWMWIPRKQLIPKSKPKTGWMICIAETIFCRFVWSPQASLGGIKTSKEQNED